MIAFLRTAARRRAGSAGGVQLHAGAAHRLPLGVPGAGRWQEILNSDAKVYGGGGWGNLGGVEAVPLASHGQPWSLALTLPALATVVLREVAGG